jgi:hypothetical protein
VVAGKVRGQLTQNGPDLLSVVQIQLKQEFVQFFRESQNKNRVLEIQIRNLKVS